MSIKYKIVARQNPSDRTIPAKYNALAVSTGKIQYLIELPRFRQ